MKHIKIFHYFLFFFILPFLGTFASAASFDCTKASTKIEKFICSDGELSKLDDELASLYASVRSQNQDIVSQQRKWLREKRGTCETVDCLKLVYRERIASLRNRDQCLVPEQALVGNWKRVENGFFEEMSFSINDGEHDFNSWLHHRPEMTGKWKVENCTLKITGSSGDEIHFEFKLRKLRKNILYVFDKDNNESATYKKTALPVNPTEK